MGQNPVFSWVIGTQLFSDILEQGELSIQDLEKTTTEREVSLRSFERNSEEEEGEALEMSTAPSTQAPAGSSHTEIGRAHV